MPHYKLMYFEFRARAETTRMMFKFTDTPFEDVRIPQNEWPALKPKTPFGQLPVLEVDGRPLAQAHAIERFVAKRVGMYGKTFYDQGVVDMVVYACDDIGKTFASTFFKSEEEQAEIVKQFMENESQTLVGNIEKILDPSGYVLPNQVTMADILLFNSCEWFIKLGIESLLETFPKLGKLHKNIGSEPKIVAWMQERPVSAF